MKKPEYVSHYINASPLSMENTIRINHYLKQQWFESVKTERLNHQKHFKQIIYTENSLVRFK
jgi:hypothetical protein